MEDRASRLEEKRLLGILAREPAHLPKWPSGNPIMNALVNKGYAEITYRYVDRPTPNVGYHIAVVAMTSAGAEAWRSSERQ